MAENDFFIGWQGKIPESYKRPVRRFVVFVMIALPVLAIVIVINQKQFRDHIFQFGNVQTYTGTYFEAPVPIFVVDDPNWDQASAGNALLVGYGKHGAEGIFENIESKYGELNGRRMHLQGTLIQGDGKTLIELTRKDKSIVEIIGLSEKNSSISPDREVQLEGEILDPKCYFGVMKPGEGKAHKSCAIRCISGGIPPVLRTGREGAFEYYVILGSNGEKINRRVLPYVAEPVSIKGIAFSARGWNFIKIGENDIKILKN